MVTVLQASAINPKAPAASLNARVTAAPVDSLKHITSLDGVRGLAIGLVLMLHLLASAPQTGSRFTNFIFGVRDSGWIGVDLFFSLSGFLITGILFDTLRSNNFFKNFYARRVLRIFPLYYGVLLVLLLVFHPANWNQGRQLYLLLAYLQNTLLWWNGPQSDMVKAATGHLWSLAVEEQFYLVWPVLIFWIRDRRRLMWTAAALAVTAPVTRALLLHHGASFEATYKLTICRADSLLAGAWLAMAVRGPVRKAVLRFATPVFCFAILLCGIMAWRAGNFNWQTSHAVNSYGYSVVALASTSLIAMALRAGSFTAKLMRNQVLRWLGKYSYGIYVFHQVVRPFIGLTFTAFLHDNLHSRTAFRLAIIVGTVVISLPLALLSFHFYEQPFLKLKRYFNYSSAERSNQVGGKA